MKRGFDFICALAGLILLSPLLAGLWLAVVVESGLPGLFRQERMGRSARPFTLFKFRSMTEAKAEGGKREAETETEDAGWLVDSGGFDAGDTSRVTKVGRILRKTKLDELPQLWNVLKGDMSLVGPRPEVRKWVDAYPERWTRVLTVKPGITDPASIEFRNEEELLAEVPDPENHYRTVILPRKLDLYESYVANRTFPGDIAILLKTAGTVIRK